MPEILYRKWRPRAFAELAGQEHVTTTLTNALATGRIAHAYLFSGPRGTGKTSSGRLLGKALNCTHRVSGEPCNECESCVAYGAGRAMDLIELDAASNRGIDEIRSLRDKVAFAPGAGEYKVYLIDEVHMLTDAAFNALLKTLEEPPPHVVFILATTEAHKVPATILSRCQRFDFRRVPLASAVIALQRICEAESIRADPAALEMIARSATGSMRDAINLLDQLATSYGDELSVEHVKAGLGLIGDERSAGLARLILEGDLAGGLELIASIRDDGLELKQFQKELVDELRTLLLVKSGIDPAAGLTDDERRARQEVVERASTNEILAALKAFGEADFKENPHSTLPLDIALAECILGRGQLPVAAAPARVAEPPAPRRVTAPAQPSRPAPIEAPVSRPPAPEPVAAKPTSEPAAPKPPPWAQPEETPDTPVPSQAPAPSASSDSGDAVAARKHLRSILERTKNPVSALLIGPCDIIDANEHEVVFGFKFPAHMQRMNDPKSLEMLREAVCAVMGKTVNVRCVLDDNVEAWTAREPASRSALVRAAQQMGARVVTTEPEEQL